MKKIMKLFVISLIALSLVACTGNKDVDNGENGDTGSNEPVNLKVWGAQEEQEFLQDRIETFKAEYPDTEFNIELGVVGEPDARDQVTQDLDATADIFSFPND